MESHPFLLFEKFDREEKVASQSTTRRNALAKLFVSIVAIPNIFNGRPLLANAACLSGDTDEKCIGVYKVPATDAEILPFVGTPEALARYAPDVNAWVPPTPRPKSFKEARTTLVSSSKICHEELPDSILSGHLIDGGQMLLKEMPLIAVSGDYILTMLTSSPYKNKYSFVAMKVEAALVDLTAYLGQSDVLIGQGLRGELGASAAAQLQILSELKDANEQFDILLQSLPEQIS